MTSRRERREAVWVPRMGEAGYRLARVGQWLPFVGALGVLASLPFLLLLSTHGHSAAGHLALYAGIGFLLVMVGWSAWLISRATTEICLVHDLNRKQVPALGKLALSNPAYFDSWLARARNASKADLSG